jgi:hypothetical protein
MPPDMLPIIHPGSLELRVVEPESERLNQMKRGVRGGTQPRHVPGVRRNFRLN